MSNFTFNVDVGDLSAGIVIKLENAIEKGTNAGIAEMRRLAHQKVLTLARKYNVPEQTLAGLEVRVSDEGLTIAISGADVMYVEYGTGMIGSSNSHPDSGPSGWKYDVNHHGESGWWYPTTANDTNPTKKESGDGFIAWTQGVKSRPFMYETYLWAYENFNNIITRAIEDEIRRIRL